MAQPPLPSGWSSGDVALIAAFGAVLAAAIAFCGALFAASINAWSARKIARDNARRDLLSKSFKPYMDKINERIGTCHQLRIVGGRIVDTLNEMAEKSKEADDDEVADKYRATISDLAARLISLTDEIALQHVSDYDPALLAHGDQKLVDANGLWIESMSNFTKRASEFGFDGAGPKELADLQDLIWKASVQGAIVIAVMQEVIVGRSLWSRKVYALTRRLGRAKIQI